MQFDWWTFALQVINMVVLIWLLSRFLFRPIARIIEERRAAIAQTLQSAEDAKLAAEAARQEAEAVKAKNAAGRFKLLEEARAEAEKQKSELVAEARKESAGIVEAAKSAAEKHSEEARARQLRQASELAVSVSRRLIANMPDDKLISGYDKRLAAILEKLDAEQKDALIADAGQLQLVAPRRLDKAELAAARRAVRAVIPDGGNIPLVVDKKLIAGLELRSPHAVIHNSVGSDFERMVEALARETQG